MLSGTEPGRVDGGIILIVLNCVSHSESRFPSLSATERKELTPRRCLKLGPRPSWAVLKGSWSGFLSLGAELPVRTAAVWLQSASCGV